MSAKYEDLTPHEFRARLKAAPIAYLPLGTLEWHGEHLPLGADGLQSGAFMELLARKVGGVVLPMLFLAPDKAVEHEGRPYYGMDFYGFKNSPPQQLDGSAYWVDDDLYGRILDATLANLARAGFRIVVGHGHGPAITFFRRHADEWRERFGLRCLTCWEDGAPKGMGLQADHAAANETSLVMALRPELVRMQELPADPAEWPVAVSGDDPRVHASPARGREIIARALDRMSALLADLLASLKD